MTHYKRKKVIYAIVLIAVLNVLLTASVAATGEVLWYYPPMPQGDVGIRRPTILWTFSGLTSDQIKEINMTIDGRRVDAVFKDDLNSIYYKPPKNFTPGRRSVSILVILKNGVRVSSPSFSFNILSSAFEEVPWTPVYEEVRDRINYYRNIIGLQAMTIEASLNAAANSHALYVNDNINAGHFESNKKHRYFTGEMPWDRTRYFGYTSSMVAENIHFMESHTRAVDDWMDSLYHRLPIINPIYAHMGYGYAAKGTKPVNVLEMGSVKYNDLNSSVVVYPGDGQEGVPITWSGLEKPDPLRLYPEAKGPGGYPITLLLTGDRVERVELKSASLLEGETKELKFYSFDAVTDPELIHSNTVAIIPKITLKPRTVYRVNMTLNVTYTGDEQKEVKKEWKFTTGNGEFETYRPGDDILVYLNGSRKIYNPAPIMKNDRVMVPVRSMCEDLGAIVNWYGDSYTVEVISKDNVITFDIGGKRVFVNGRLVRLDAPAELLNGVTFVPARFVSEVLGYNVIWDGVMRMVMIQGA